MLRNICPVVARAAGRLTAPARRPAPSAFAAAANSRPFSSEELVPGHFGIYYQIDRPSKQDNEAKVNAKFLEKTEGMEDWEILQQNFDKMK